MSTEYDDDYPTCRKTHATLRIYHDDLSPERVTELLRIQPSRTQVKGLVETSRIGRKFTPPIGGWFLSTDETIGSRDLHRHLDWILERLAGRDEVLRKLQAEGCRMDVLCYWLSAEGHGGPTLSPSIMRRLGELELEFGLDIYGPYEN